MAQNIAYLTEMLNFLPQVGINFYESLNGNIRGWLNQVKVHSAASTEKDSEEWNALSIVPQGMRSESIVLGEYFHPSDKKKELSIRLFQGDGVK